MPIRQLEKVEKIKEIGEKLWVEVLNIKRNLEFIGESIYVKGILLKKSKSNDELENETFNHLIHLDPYCYSDGTYLRFANEDVERFVDYRQNLITKNFEPSITEEFIYFHDLYKEKDSYYKLNENGEKEEIVKIDKNSILVKKKFLKQYLAIKDMVLAVCFEFSYYCEDETTYKQNEKIKYNNTIFNNFIGNCYGSNYKSCGFIMGKKIIKGMAKEDTNLWEYEKPPEYLEFIIGTDPNCKEVLHTCNPSKLGNIYFNDIKPDFLTPIYFKKEVLSKYYQSDVFEVTDNTIRAHEWLLKMDNQRDQVVSVYLGDLADLPYSEQQYWKCFNIVSDCGISKTSFDRDFMVKWVGSEALDLSFKSNYKNLNKKWKEKFGWQLFKDLHSEDSHYLKDLRIPVSFSQSEFDLQILAFVKVLLDSLNEKELKKVFPQQLEDISGSISILEKILELKNCTDIDIKKNMGNLKNIQNLRSTGTAHRKSKNYDKAKKRLEIKDKNFIEAFKIILSKGLEFLEFLDRTFL